MEIAATFHLSVQTVLIRLAAPVPRGVPCANFRASPNKNLSVFAPLR